MAATSGPTVVPKRLRHVQQRAGLLGEGVGDRRVAWPSEVTARPHEEVEVALAVVVPQRGALAAHERHRRRRVGGHERVRHGRVSGHHRADAVVGEELEQQDVGHAAVEDVGVADAVARRRGRTTATFGIIPPVSGAVGDQGARARRRSWW